MVALGALFSSVWIIIANSWQQTPAGFHIVGDRFSVEPFGIGIRHGDWQMRDAVNAVLQDLWASGRYQQIYRQWFQLDPDIAIETWPKG